MRADVFVRRLIERIGFRRHRLFAAHPEAAERLRGLSRLGELAAAWTRREPTGSNRDFVRYLVAVSEAGVEAPVRRAAVAGRRAGLGRVAAKGLEFSRVFVLGSAGAVRACRPWCSPEAGATGEDAGGNRGGGHGEELFGPAEGMQATYRMIQDEVLEEAWRAGGKLREPRLDTYVDVTGRSRGSSSWSSSPG